MKSINLSKSHKTAAQAIGNEKPQRRGSVGSLDSGMSISYTSASTGSRDTAKVRLQQQFQQQPPTQPNQGILNAMNSGISPLLLASGGSIAAAGGSAAQPGFLGAIFNRRERKLSKSDESGSTVVAAIPATATTNDRSTEV